MIEVGQDRRGYVHEGKAAKIWIHFWHSPRTEPWHSSQAVCLENLQSSDKIFMPEQHLVRPILTEGAHDCRVSLLRVMAPAIALA